MVEENSEVTAENNVFKCKSISPFSSARRN